jgi:AcrR family transcriptional regulator
MDAISEEPKEESIRRAAEVLFLEKGFKRTSMADIAQEAGCNQALIHYYFRTKDRLFKDIFMGKIELIFSSLVGRLEETLSFEEALTLFIEKQYDMILQNPRIPFLVLTEIHSSPERVVELETIAKEKFSYVISFYDRMLKAAVAEGSIRPISVISLFMNIISLNVAMFLGKPLLIQSVGMSEKAFQEAAAARKAENVEFILRSLRP